MDIENIIYVYDPNITVIHDSSKSKTTTITADLLDGTKELIQGIKIILDFIPNHSSDEHEWFGKSIQRIDPYTDYYVWKDAKIGKDGSKSPPNNWQSLFNYPAWTWNEKRGQYYLHQFDPKQPDLNYRCSEMLEEMKNNIRFWLDHGVDGYRVDAVPFLFEDSKFLDEPRKPEPIASKEDNTWDQIYHPYTMDVDETYDLIVEFRKVFDEYKLKDGIPRVMITEGYTTLENTLRFYGTKKDVGADLPFNFELIKELTDQSNAPDFYKVVNSWLDHMPKHNWPNWVIGNHDRSRVATRFGREMVDGMNMLNLLLPGTAFTYMGEEIGMEDTNLRYSQTEDPLGRKAGPVNYKKMTRDPFRTPFQWDASVNAGFTDSDVKPWLPINPNSWCLNLEAQKKDDGRNGRLSHYTIYKRLAALRKTRTMCFGSYKGHVVSEWVFAFSRSLPGAETYVVVINLGTEEELINLSGLKAVAKNRTLIVHTSSINSQYFIGDTLNTRSFKMRSKSALVLTDRKQQVTLSSLSSVASSLIVPSVMTLIVLGCILVNRCGILGA